MVQSLLPCNAAWLHTHILGPYIEGSERIERAWIGKEIPSFIDTPLSCKERIILLIKGALLMIPLINTIIWVAMQVFGERKLSVSYCPLTEGTRASLPPPELSVPAAILPPETPSSRITPPSPVPTTPRPPEEHPTTITPAPSPLAASHAVDLPPPHTTNPQILWYEEKIDKHTFEGRWALETSNNQTKIEKTSTYNNATAIHNQNGHLQSIHNEVPSENKIFHAEIQQDGKIKASVSLNGKLKTKTLEITGKGTWIQQPLFGLQNFALSDDKEIKFFFIHPEDLSIIEMRAKKTKIEFLERLGNLLRIEANLDYWGAGAIHKGLTWVDPATGIGRKSDCPPLSFWRISIPHMTELFLPDHP